MLRCWLFVDARWHRNSTEICGCRDRSSTHTRIKNELGWPSVWQSCRCWSWLWKVYGFLFDKIVFIIHLSPFFSRSSQLLGVAEKYSGLLDGMVLMSSAPDIPSLLTSFAASSIGIASLNNKNRFGEHRLKKLPQKYLNSPRHVCFFQVHWIPPILFPVISMTHNDPCFISPILILVSFPVHM